MQYRIVVWKPLKPDIEYEEYEYNEDQTECRILIGLENNKQRLQEVWKLEDEWKILELRFLKP